METEELTKLVDGIYKNILDKFNPGARQMITAGKAYLKALHGAAAASRLYVEAVSKLGRQAQQGTWGGSADIGTALMKVVEVYKDIQDQQMNILKAFYVDLLVPLETNLEKDTKVVQSEQKRFLQQHKLRSESYSKAAAAIKKQRKKNTRSTAKSGSAVDKELKSMQTLDEEKTKLDAFCEQSLKNAMTQERRRYGFVLERQCSLAKHWLAYHNAGSSSYQQGLDEWQDIVKTREYLPPNVEAMFINKMKQVSFWANEDLYASPRAGGGNGHDSGDDLDRLSIGSALRKTRSVDASCLDLRSMADLGGPMPSLNRAKSDFNLASSTPSLDHEEMSPNHRPRSIAIPQPPSWEASLARALYAYFSFGDNQLSFLEGDMIALLGERSKGWQYGENLRTQKSGWFPIAYTEMILDDVISSPGRWGCSQPPNQPPPTHNQLPPLGASPGGDISIAPSEISSNLPISLRSTDEIRTSRMFGDTINSNKKNNWRFAGPNPSGPPPALPAPVPTPTVPGGKRIAQSQSSTNFQAPSAGQPKSATMKTSASNANFTSAQDAKTFGPQTLPMRGQAGAILKSVPKGVTPVGNVSLHSSNDSGFSNEPPPQPEIDYSDEETHHRNRVPISRNGSRYEEYGKHNRPRINSLKRHDSTNLMNKSHLTDDQQIMLRSIIEMDTESQKIKRSKSFWKFSRGSSDILEGMAMWKHNDLIDLVSEYKKKVIEKIQNDLHLPNGNHNSYKTESEDGTIKNGNFIPPKRAERQIDRKEMNNIRQSKSMSSIHHSTSKTYDEPANGVNTIPREQEQANRTQNKRKEEKNKEEFTSRNDGYSNHSDITNSTIKSNFENSFFDDENGQGLIVKTVKRKEILQRYDNASTVSEAESIASSATDQYDCIIVDDHITNQRSIENGHHRNGDNYVAENVKKNNMKNGHSYDNSNVVQVKPVMRMASVEKQVIRTDPKPEQRTHVFKTFKNNESEIKAYSESNETLKYEDHKQDNQVRERNPETDDRKYYHNYDGDSKSVAQSKSYHDQRNEQTKRYIAEQSRSHAAHEINKYYTDHSLDRRYEKSVDRSEQEKPQLLPRTKLLKQGNGGTTLQTVMKFEEEIDVMNTRTKERLTRDEFDDLPAAGHTFGPWYDLWGEQKRIIN